MKEHFFVNHESPKFIEFIKDNMRTCQSFSFSVSFIKKSGLVLIEKDIIQALKRGAKGKIITSTYQNFTDTASLKDFNKWMDIYPNFECHLETNNLVEGGMHSKGYLFEHEDKYTILVGSTNLTRFALLHNIEWNMVIESASKSNAYLSAEEQFLDMWSRTVGITEKVISDYEVQLEYAIESWDMDYYHHMANTTPNYMQRKALKELRRYRDQGVQKALIVAATGSGKTYLAAFDAKNYQATKLLFVVHRETILHDAMQTFSIVFGPNYRYGLFSGSDKDFEADFVFATNITLSNNLDLFDKQAFNYIILDEVHHAAASTYQKIIDYFNPGFLLGLTATPERMDNQDIYGMFDRNVPFDLRLRDAIINDLVVPFHYYGIRNQLVNYDERDVNRLIRDISSQDNCLFLGEEIDKYRPLSKLKAIGFCKNTEHARRMSEGMNLLGFHTTYLLGSHHTGERIKAFNDLQNEKNPLEIIFAVDILNEGVDIPSINMVLFLRPTDSPVVFLQQLGRGLRKFPNKKHLQVLDFIGNSYKRSVQIIRALGTLSKSTVFEKKLLIDLIRDDFRSIDIPGVQIHFDQLSKEDITSYIEKTNFNTLEFLKNDFLNFKKYIKADPYPKHMDYLNHDFAPDLMRFCKSRIGSKNVSYYRFLSKIGENIPIFDDNQIAFIDFISDMLPLIRYEEFAILEALLTSPKTRIELLDELELKYEKTRINQFDNALHHLLNGNMSDKEKSESVQYVLSENDQYILNLSLDDFDFKEFVIDIIEYGLTRYNEEYGNFEGSFKLYGNYTYEQFMMSLCEKTYRYYKGTKIHKDGTVYILANLKKDNRTLEHLKYRDRFISNRVFQWESETRTTIIKDKGLIHSKVAHVFIRKIESEDGITLPFIYLGSGQLTNPRVGDNPEKTLIFDVILDKPIPDYLLFDFQVEDEYDDK